MLEIIARLLVALGVSAGGAGVAGEHASPQGSPKAIAAIEAVIARLGEADPSTDTSAGPPVATALERAGEIADEHAADALASAAAAKAAGRDGADAADPPEFDAPPVDAPPVDPPVADGPPDSHPPFDAPPVPTPPVDAPGQGNRP